MKKYVVANSLVGNSKVVRIKSIEDEKECKTPVADYSQVFKVKVENRRQA